MKNATKAMNLSEIMEAQQAGKSFTCSGLELSEVRRHRTLEYTFTCSLHKDGSLFGIIDGYDSTILMVSES